MQAKKTIAACALLSLSGCASTQQTVAREAQLPAYTQSTICELRANRAASMGKIFRVKGVFVSDGLTFGYFEDTHCGAERNSMFLGTTLANESVKAFDQYQMKNCQPYCSKDVELDVAGVVTENDEGLLRLELVHVYSLSPRQREN